MRLFATVFIALTCLCLTHAPAYSQKVKGLVVKTTIADADVNFNPYSIQSDHLGIYQNGVSSVESIIQGIGDWEMDALSSSTRRATVSFNNPVPGTIPNNQSAPPNGSYPVRFITQCPSAGYNLNTLTLNSTAVCPMIVALDIGNTRYSLRFYSRNFPGSEDVRVTCTTASSTGKCTTWILDSRSGDAESRIAQVYKVTRVGNRETLVDQGKYYFSFQIKFTSL